MSVMEAQARSPQLLATRSAARASVVAVAPAVAPAVSAQSAAPTLLVAGLRGPAGTSGATYRHNQTGALDTWIVNHNLGYQPSISAFSIGGKLMLVDVQHFSDNQARIYFDGPVAGYAVCS